MNLVSPQAQAFIDSATDVPEERLPELMWQRARAVKVLDAELASPARVSVGLACWLLALVGGAGLVVATWHGAPWLLRVVGVVVAVALLGPAFRWGRTVRRAGRRVVDAFTWWTLLPDRLPEGRPNQRGGSAMVEAAQARAWYLHPRRLGRATVASLAFLAPLVFLMSMTNEEVRWEWTWPSDQTLALAVAFAAVAVPSWYAGAATASGLARAGSAQGQRDPLTRALVGRSRRR